LTTGNFLIDKKHQVYIIDLNRARLNKKMSISLRLDDLRKIYFPDRIPGKITALFWDAYRRESGIDIDWALLYRQKRALYRARRQRNTRLKQWLRRSE